MKCNQQDSYGIKITLKNAAASEYKRCVMHKHGMTSSSSNTSSTWRCETDFSWKPSDCYRKVLAAASFLYSEMPIRSAHEVFIRLFCFRKMRIHHDLASVYAQHRERLEITFCLVRLLKANDLVSCHSFFSPVSEASQSYAADYNAL